MPGSFLLVRGTACPYAFWPAMLGRGMPHGGVLAATSRAYDVGELVEPLPSNRGILVGFLCLKQSLRFPLQSFLPAPLP